MGVRVGVQPGVIVNANARRVRRDPGLVGRLRRLVPAECLRVTASLEEIGPALAELRSHDTDALVPVGGDGTLMRTVTALLRDGEPADTPPIVPTRGGTVNTVATSLGARGAPDRTLARLLERGPGPGERRAVVRVAADGAPPVFGFLFVNGVGVRWLELYYADSVRGVTGALSVVGRIAASALVGGGLARRTFAPFDAVLEVDDAPPESGPFTVIAAGAVRDIGLGFRPFRSAGSDPERIHLATTAASAARLVRELPALRAGAAGACLRHQTVCRVEIATPDPAPWSLDAELFPPARRLEVGAGPALHVVHPAGRRVRYPPGLHGRSP